MDTPMDALPLRIWRLSLLPYDSAQLQGWGAALVLILIIMGINLAVKYHYMNKENNGLIQLIKQRINTK
jgi:phosphate transport system permease protein